MKAALGLFAAAAIGISGLAFSSSYIIDEGRVGVITNMGQAIRQEGPDGLQFKTPFIQGVREFDVRERIVNLTLVGTTSNQLSTNLAISVNWRPDPNAILQIFREYGGPEEFATNVLIPRLSQGSKATVGQFTSVQLTQERNAVAEAILQNAIGILQDYPIILSSVQLEDFTLPPRYWEAVIAREEQRELTEKEALILEQQDLTAQQDVQTAQAERDATVAKADGEAYRVRTEAEAQADAIRLRGSAEADAIRAVQDALADNPLYVDLVRAQNWNGQLPSTILGDSPDLLMQMPN